jgi:hypothetical protein
MRQAKKNPLRGAILVSGSNHISTHQRPDPTNPKPANQELKRARPAPRIIQMHFGEGVK